MAELAIILPTYNEAENLTLVVEQLEGLGLDLHVLVVDDNSRDGTQQIALEMGERFGNVTLIARPKKLGLGSAIKAGLIEALATDATGILAVKGHFFDDGTGPRLCEGLVGLGERYGCDGQHISVTNLDSDTLGTSVVFHDGLTYTEDLLTLFGELVDGSLIVDNLVAG